MLGKLVKHDFIATWKLPAALDVLVIALGIMTGLLIQLIPHVEGSMGIGIFMLSFIGVFYIGIIAANVVTIILIVMRYYRNLYTAEGYLTFTLPVKTDMIVHSKVITGAVWMFLSYVSTIISILIAGSGFITAFDVSGKELREFIRELYSLFGANSPGFIVVIVLTFLITPAASALSMYFCVSVGQLWHSHKILGTVLCIIGIYIVNQVFSQVSFFASGFWGMMTSTGADIDASFGGVYLRMLIILLIFEIIESAVFYAVCLIINRNKVNLD